MTVSQSDNTEALRPQFSIRTLCFMAGALLLAGGILLDMNRILGVRDTLDRVARLAATEAMASNRPADREHICEKRLNKGIWTNTEVNLEDFSVTVDDSSKQRTATVSYDVSVNLVVGRFFGFDEVTISGEVEAEAAPALVAMIP